MANVAFYTINDQRPLGFVPGQPATSAVYRAVAQHVAPHHAFGVANISAAMISLRPIPQNSIHNVFFVGHGYAVQGGGYFFGGHAVAPYSWDSGDPTEEFYTPEHAGDLNAQFIGELARILTDYDDLRCQTVHVYFLSCLTGSSTLIRAIADALDANHVGNVHGTRVLHGIDIDQSSGAPTGLHRSNADAQENPIGPRIAATGSLDSYGHLEVTRPFGTPNLACLDI